MHAYTSEQTHVHMLPGPRGGHSTNTHSGFPIPLLLHLVLEDENKGGDDDGNNNGHDNRHDYDVGTKGHRTPERGELRCLWAVPFRCSLLEKRAKQ